MREIVEPVIAGMAADGHPFRGFLYAGLMLTPDGPKVIEFNVRLGDPEAQVILPLVDEPLLPLLVAGAAGRDPSAVDPPGGDRLVGVVLASRGYPDSAESGQAIDGIDRAEAIAGVSVYHAGTERRRRRVGYGWWARAHRGRPRRRLRRSDRARYAGCVADYVRRDAVPAATSAGRRSSAQPSASSGKPSAWASRSRYA